MRKVDNELFDEIYFVNGAKDTVWDQREFVEIIVRSLLIKDSNKYKWWHQLSLYKHEICAFVVSVKQIYSIIKTRENKNTEWEDTGEHNLRTTMSS